MVFGNLDSAFDRQQLANIEHVVGPPTAENQPGEHGPWWLRGSLRGRPVWLGLLTRGTIRGIDFAASLAGRPIHLSIRDRRRTTILGVPEVRTGDPRFDEEFLVSGWPAEVIAAALDADVRGWLLATCAGKDPQVSTRENRVQLFRSLATFSAGLGVPPEAAMPPAEIGHWLDVVGRLADSLVAAFDRSYAALAHERGAAVAQAWAQAQVDAFGALGRSRARFRFVVLGGVLTFCAALLGAIVLIATRC